MMTEQHKINYKNIGMILLLGIVAISVGMKQPINFAFTLPNFAAPVIISSSEPMQLQNSIGSIASIALIVVVMVFACGMMYLLMGLGGLGGRR